MDHMDESELARTWFYFKYSSPSFERPVGCLTTQDAEWLEDLAFYQLSNLDERRLQWRNDLVVHYASLVRFVAAKVDRHVPAEVEKDDLTSYGMFGLMDAIEKFNIGRGVKFETYAMTRIHGAIYDEIRALDWVPRSIRSKTREIERARTEIEEILGRPASHEEVAQSLGLCHDDYWRLASQASVTPVDALAESQDTETMGQVKADPMGNPAELFENTEIAYLISGAISTMDDRSKTILALYYLQEMTLAEIGEVLGVTESRVCQLQSKVLLSLRESLGQGGLVAA